MQQCKPLPTRYSSNLLGQLLPSSEPEVFGENLTTTSVAAVSFR